MRIRLFTLCAVWSCLFCVALSSSSAATAAKNMLRVDATPSGVVASQQYTVHVKKDGARVSSFVYQDQNPGFLPNGQPSGIVSSSTLEHGTAWTSFSFDGSVTVEVTNSHAFTSARILPSHAGIVPVVRGSSVFFTVEHPGQFAVDFCDTGETCSEANDTDLTNPMLVFANPLEKGRPDVMDASVLSVKAGLSVPGGDALPVLGAGQSTIYFGPGIYDLGLTALTVASNERVYLAAGAYVRGFLAFALSATNATIEGRGILSGEDLPKAQCISTAAGCPDMVVGRGKLENLRVEGLTFIESPFYNVSINGGAGNTVDNVKVIAWLGNSDGIQASFGAQDTGSVIENSFVKNGDDSIKITASNLVVRHCVVWKLNNAAAFEMGAGIGTDVTNVTVRDSDVIRGEYSYPNASDAVISANQGGSGNLSNYKFEDIRVENENWQLFKVVMSPSNFQPDNYVLGSIRGLEFKNIQATDAQKFGPVFQGYDRAHPVADVSFEDVVVAGESLPTPVLTLDANRNKSFAGNTVSDLLFRDEDDPTQFAIPLFTLAAPAIASQYTLFSISQPAMTAKNTVRGSDDFFGDGYASVVVMNAENGDVGLWKEPYLNTAKPRSEQYAVIYTLSSADGVVAGTGDFNGDGYADLLLWNASAQTGKIVCMQGGKVAREQVFRPASGAGWSVATVADFTGDGRSDVMLRDAAGDVEVVSFKSIYTATIAEYPVAMLGYASTPNYTAAYGSTTGTFDASWRVVGSGVLQTLGTLYASVVWTNDATGQVGITRFTPFLKNTMSGQVFAKLPADTGIAAFGDFNGDGGKDLLLRDSETGEDTVWFMNFYSDNDYAVGPTLEPSLPGDLVVTPD